MGVDAMQLIGDHRHLDRSAVAGVGAGEVQTARVEGVVGETALEGVDEDSCGHNGGLVEDRPHPRRLRNHIEERRKRVRDRMDVRFLDVPSALDLPRQRRQP